MFFGIDLTNIIEVLGYPGIFAIVLAESGLFFGVSLPGGSLLFTSGLLASQGFLNIWILMAVILVAAVLGDSIGYWFGSWVGPTLWRRPDGRFFKKKYLEQTRNFFEKHGTRTIFLARFIPIVRTFAPIIAGVAQMEYRTFFFYNVLGAVVWGGGYTIAGYILGETVPGIEDYLEWIVLGIIVVTMIPFLLHVRAARRTRYTPSMGIEGDQSRESAEKERPRGVIFDMDDTLAESFVPPTESVLHDLVRLAHIVPTAIMSGASFERMERDILKRVQGGDATFYVFSDSAAQCHAWQKGSWREVYNFTLAPQERTSIIKAVQEAIQETGIFRGGHDTSRILDRETSVAFTALQQGATQHEKRAWDESGEKRRKLVKALKEKLPEYAILIGGKTTVDVTREGITKAYGVEWLAKELGLAPRDMLFVGDGFDEGGNDAVVIPTGIQVQETSGPAETLEIIDDLLEKFASK